MDFNSYRSENFYRVETVDGKKHLDGKFSNYEDAYIALCENYINEKESGCRPTLYSIKEYNDVWYSGNGIEHHNRMVNPSWG